jgi:hypothetical protein
MKKKTFILVSLLLATCISIISPSQANAGECSSSDPCGTWAVVDNSGTVTNIIVCQASVCGGGEFAGNKVVLQVAANPVTNDTYERGGYVSSESQTVKESDGIFTITDSDQNGRVRERVFSSPVLETDRSYTSVAAEFCSEFKLKEGDCAKVTTIKQSINETTSESDTVDPINMTESEMRQQFIDNGKALLVEKIQIISRTIAKLMKIITNS